MKLLNYTTLIVLFLIAHTFAQAQSFDTPEVNPWGLSTASQQAQLTLVDIDADGDLDIFLGNGSEFPDFDIQFYENTGSPTSPSFGNPETNPFGLSAPGSRARLAFADLDNDGDQDLLIGQKLNEVEYFENTGDASNPQFAAGVEDPFGIEIPISLQNVAPTFADLDADGDIDLLVATSGNDFYYYENEGDVSNPQFGASQQNPFGLAGDGNSIRPILVDLDMDGDFDVLTGDLSGVIRFYENTGSANAPAFNEILENPFGIEYYFAKLYPSAGDLDADGDPDLLIGTGDLGTETGDFRYFANQEISGIFNPIVPLKLQAFPNPTTDFIYFENPEEMEIVEMYNPFGQLLMAVSASANGMDLSAYPSGMYLLKASLKDGNIATQLIIKE
ncbi:MAG: T9SS type A sorting domain-containing protein [Bacteroidetes bacterium]|nr:T9SS type A sorting domain-containing protein [Bacteroidota bacterium]